MHGGQNSGRAQITRAAAAIEAAPGTVEALHAVLGASPVIPRAADFGCMGPYGTSQNLHNNHSTHT